MCVNTKRIINKRYTITKKNGGNIPPCPDERQRTVEIPCGQCYQCKKKKGREWRMRITEDIKVNKNCKIVTLTFNTESLKKIAEQCKDAKGYELDNQICKWAVKHFRERWRKKYGRSIRHWLITELGHGETEHVHMHGIIWEDDRYKLEDTLLNEVEKIWQYGYVGKGKRDYKTGKIINYVSAQTANYFTKYVTKIDEQHKEYRQIILTSAGIGASYLTSAKAKDNIYKGKNTKQTYTIDTGGSLPMPDYLRRKMYTDEQRIELTKEYLDKPVIYIAGKEVRKEIGDVEIKRIKDEERQKNKRLGYDEGQKNWARKIAENKKRREIQYKRYLKDVEKQKKYNIIVTKPIVLKEEEYPEWVRNKGEALKPNYQQWGHDDMMWL